RACPVRYASQQHSSLSGRVPVCTPGNVFLSHPHPASTQRHSLFGSGFTYALCLEKPMVNSTSRLELDFIEPDRLWRSLRGRILLYRSSLAAIV
ncbi:hypothetical protein GOODEAATRI_014453, partial [Goodea atripinnis]